ncbi:class I SAM-dependent methyltransferase [Chitinimonas sp.]|uniref:class I SAM-dependent methyltransferase n=1 Tax=Chitinimonas sp. TaxID=1934313 RepID=UPI0035B1AF00
MNILDAYVLKPPAAQNIIDLFDGEWSTAMPPASGLQSRPGTATLFQAPQVQMAAELFGGFAGKTVLELGPLEGAHSYMLQQGGAASVTAIEANSRAFLKCLCIKEVFKLDRVQYLLGDFVSYLRDTSQRFDIALASGVLYHMQDPLELLSLLAKASDNIVLWTHYYDAEVLNANPRLRKKYSPLQDGERNGFSYQWVVQSYEESLNWSGFCGGSAETSVWLTRQSIVDYLAVLGFIDVRVAYDAPHHQNGPSFAVFASRQPMQHCRALSITHYFRAELNEVVWQDNSLNMQIALQALAGGDAADAGMYIGVELDGKLLIAEDAGLQALDGVPPSPAPLRKLARHNHQLSLSLPCPVRPSAIYIGFGNSLEHVQQHAAWGRIELDEFAQPV